MNAPDFPLTTIEVWLRAEGFQPNQARTIIASRGQCAALQIGQALIELGEDWIVYSNRCACCGGDVGE